MPDSLSYKPLARERKQTWVMVDARAPHLSRIDGGGAFPETFFLMNRKPPHQPSLEQQIAGAVVGVAFGIAWTMLAIVISRSSPLGMGGKVFPLIGIAVIGFALFRLVTLLRRLRERKEGGGSSPTLWEGNRQERQRKRLGGLAGSVVGVFFFLGMISVARAMGTWLPGKIFLLVGLGGLFFFGRNIYRLIREWLGEA